MTTKRMTGYTVELEGLKSTVNGEAMKEVSQREEGAGGAISEWEESVVVSAAEYVPTYSEYVIRRRLLTGI